MRMFEIIFRDRLRSPRALVVELGAKYCEVVTESGGIDSFKTGSDRGMTKEEWLVWTEQFRDELTGKEFREIQAAAEFPFKWPQVWLEFKARYEATGNAFLN